MFTYEEKQPLVSPVSITDENKNVVCVINILKFAGAARNPDDSWNVYLGDVKEILLMSNAQFKQLYQKLCK